MKIVVFGLGRIYQKRKDVLIGHQIVGYIDNNEELWGTIVDGVGVFNPKKVCFLDYDVVCIMSKCIDEMKKQLIELGVSERKIVNYNEVSGRNLILYDKFADISKSKKKVLFFTHDFSVSGAPIVLFYFARILKRYGFDPAVISRTEGIMQQDFLSEGIPVIINSDLTKSNWLLWKIIEGFDFYVLNTIIFADIIEEIGGIGKKTIWWLHDSEIYYADRNDSFFPRFIPNNVSIYAVGERAKGAFEKYVGFHNVKNLIYGIPDRVIPRIGGGKKKKTIFAVIGAICPRKAQDVFIQAVELLSKVQRSKAEFWIIGIATDISFFENIKLRMEKIDEVKYLGDLTREDMLKKYQDIDVVCCPSRDDPMPVVMAEAFMNGKVVIVSENTGTAPLIKNEEDGFVVQVEDAEQLAGFMGRILNGTVNIESMGKRSRQIYERNFSLDAFEREIVKIAKYLEEL